MLADHVPRATCRSRVVVGEGFARRDEDVSYPRQHLLRHVAEPASSDDLVAGGNPGPVILGLLPDGQYGVAVRIRFEMELEAARLPRHVSNPVEQARSLIDEYVRVVRDVEDSVICREEHPVARA